MMATDDLVYAIITNIPSFYHSADLRNFFSEYVEVGNFDCFHFRHRPEIRKVRKEDLDESLMKSSTCCCVVCLRSSHLAQLIGKYSQKHWLDKNDETLALKCFISKVKVSSENNVTHDYKTRRELKVIPFDRETFSRHDLNGLEELNPPSIMPNGNVGTPTTYFLELIRSCKMPARIIGKLGLIFPKMRGKGRYAAVHYNYGGQVVVGKQEESLEATSGRGKPITSGYTTPPEVEDKPEASEIFEEDDDDCEDWERHISLHEDVTEQGRTKERLYEEEIELKWEKGGSGLVFYTDAQHWDQLNGDFDERTADDWDVDMGVYYEEGAGDRDSKEHAQIRLEKRRRKGNDESVFQKRIGAFDQYTKGIGRKVMKKFGWCDGQGLGKGQGLLNALENEGQHPKDKRGFGYHGERLSTVVRKRPRQHYVSTVYDNPSEVELVADSD